MIDARAYILSSFLSGKCCSIGADLAESCTCRPGQPGVCSYNLVSIKYPNGLMPDFGSAAPSTFGFFLANVQ
jgi:hypothetical protein